MAKIGIIGLGMMGRTHHEAYQKIPDAAVVAVADIDPKRAAGDLAGTGGNVLQGGITHLPMDRIKGFTDYQKLLAMNEVDVVDVCVPTVSHVELAINALKAGKHVVCEKPLGRTSAQAKQLADAAAKSKGFFMPAMCMRFWPHWEWLKQAADEKRYGKILAATFRRCASMPAGWYADGKASGGALLDLHVHDVDFVYYLFGMPEAVHSRGYSRTSGAIDHLITQYLYKNGGPLVSAEGGWCMADGFGFIMRYTVNFEKATADFDIGRKDQLILHQSGKSEPVACADQYGYERELAYFLQCVSKKQKPTTVTAQDAVNGITIVEAEQRSVESGQVVKL